MQTRAPASPRLRSAIWSACLLAAGALASCANPPPSDEEEVEADGGQGGFPTGGAFIPSGGHPFGGGSGGGGGGVQPPPGGDGPGGAPQGGDPGGNVVPVGGDPGGTIVPPVGGEGGDGGAGGGAPRPAALVAAVVLTETPQVPQAGISVTVTEPVQIPNAPGCSVVAVNTGAQPAPAAGFDAGTITVSGTSAGDLTFQPTPDAVRGTVYGGGPGVQDVFQDGAVLRAHAAGGAHMGSFDVQVQAPQGVNVQSPSNGDQEGADGALTVSWNASQSESLVITVLPAESPFDPTPKSGNWVFCGVPDTGSFTIPAGTLGPVAEDADFFGQFALVTVSRTRVGLAQVGPDQAVITASTTAGVGITLTQ